MPGRSWSGLIEMRCCGREWDAEPIIPFLFSQRVFGDCYCTDSISPQLGTLFRESIVLQTAVNEKLENYVADYNALYQSGEFGDITKQPQMPMNISLELRCLLQLRLLRSIQTLSAMSLIIRLPPVCAPRM